MTAPRADKAHTAELMAQAVGIRRFCRIPLAHVSCTQALPREPYEPYRCGATPEVHARCRWCDYGGEAHLEAGLIEPGKGMPR